MASDALGLHIRGMEKDGDAVLEPSTFDAVLGDSGNAISAALLAALRHVIRRNGFTLKD